MTVRDAENEDQGIKLLIEVLEVEGRIADRLDAGNRGENAALRQMGILRRLTEEVEPRLVHEKSVEALRKVDAYLAWKTHEWRRTPMTDDERMRDRQGAKEILWTADAGLDGAVARYREMSVWSTMEPGAALAFNATWSEAISAASLVRTVACCAHFLERDGRLPGWLVMQAYSMWRSCMLCGASKAEDAMPTVLEMARDVLWRLNASREEAGHAT
jgi:hypothetical protein